jgi:hypothetical protein
MAQIDGTLHPFSSFFYTAGGKYPLFLLGSTSHGINLGNRGWEEFV